MVLSPCTASRGFAARSGSGRRSPPTDFRQAEKHRRCQSRERPRPNGAADLRQAEKHRRCRSFERLGLPWLWPRLAEPHLSPRHSKLFLCRQAEEHRRPSQLATWRASVVRRRAGRERAGAQTATNSQNGYEGASMLIELSIEASLKQHCITIES